MDRKVLIKGFLKIFIPLAHRLDRRRHRRHARRHDARARRLPHLLLHRRADHGRRRRRGRDSAVDRLRGDPAASRRATLFAQMLPPVMLGSLTAIIFAGTLNYVGKRYPHLTGEGRLQPGEHDDMDPDRGSDESGGGHMDVSTIAAAGLDRGHALSRSASCATTSSACRRRWRCCFSPSLVQADERSLAASPGRCASSSTNSSRRPSPIRCCSPSASR